MIHSWYAQLADRYPDQASLMPVKVLNDLKDVSFVLVQFFLGEMRRYQRSDLSWDKVNCFNYKIQGVICSWDTFPCAPLGLLLLPSASQKSSSPTLGCNNALFKKSPTWTGGRGSRTCYLPGLCSLFMSHIPQLRGSIRRPMRIAECLSIPQPLTDLGLVRRAFCPPSLILEIKRWGMIWMTKYFTSEDSGAPCLAFRSLSHLFIIQLEGLG